MSVNKLWRKRFLEKSLCVSAFPLFGHSEIARLMFKTLSIYAPRASTRGGSYFMKMNTDLPFLVFFYSCISPFDGLFKQFSKITILKG